ncbi:GntR family transcriptional regulator [Poseidonocella sp. HB161398]|uniref:GntR family transcriptional regulator n=1 Tax=Poseidonocella sp. HB161398 TaxID=2320855 RepID=UPI001108315C|nr:GntR family transcriptional regulator [Poseidonocella sp. HB161398]
MQATNKTETALETIRKTICIGGSGAEPLLHETELAREFGMSRTPIRQVLQRLAYERLVQTRSGVGTVATPLHDADRSRDLTTYRGILEAIRSHDLPQLTVSQQADIQALGGFAAAMPEGDAELQYELLSRMHRVLAGLVFDPVLADAFSASFWRAVRWHMRDLSADPANTSARLRIQVAHVAGHADRQAGDLFARLRAQVAD